MIICIIILVFKINQQLLPHVREGQPKCDDHVEEHTECIDHQQQLQYGHQCDVGIVLGPDTLQGHFKINVQATVRAEVVNGDIGNARHISIEHILG